MKKRVMKKAAWIKQVKNADKCNITPAQQEQFESDDGVCTVITGESSSDNNGYGPTSDGGDEDQKPAPAAAAPPPEILRWDLLPGYRPFKPLFGDDDYSEEEMQVRRSLRLHKKTRLAG